jgi:hypothetical protein
MAREIEAVFGTTRVTIQVHNQPDASAPLPFVAQAFGDGDARVLEHGEPVELAASSEEIALERMVGYLEGRFGPVK